MIATRTRAAKRTPAHRRATTWLRAMRGPRPGTYHFGTDAPVCLLGSACAALAAELLDRRRLEYERQDWIAHIGSFQRDDGLFDDPCLRPAADGARGAQYALMHQTFLATMALDALGAAPARPLALLGSWRDDDAVYRWIDQLPWDDPWRDSNWVEWIGYFLLADAGIRSADVPLLRERWPAGFGGLMAWLTEHIDRATGFWGRPALDEPWRSLNLVATAYHHYVFFYATGTPIPALDHVIDTVLALQQPGGLFLPGTTGGDPCADLDAIDVLANATRLIDYRRAAVHEALERAARAILGAQRRNGAFVWSRDPAETPTATQTLGRLLDPRPTVRAHERLRAVQAYRSERLGPRMRYAGAVGLKFRKAGGDLYSHWFRPLALAIAAQVLPAERRPISWDFGFRTQITQGWWPGGAA